MIYTSIPKRKPKKPNAAQRQLAAEWDALVKKHEPKKRIMASSASSILTPKTYIRDTGPRLLSRNTGEGVASSKPRPQYTGTNMIGIGTLHKSNAVPVFSSDEAKEMARMRRG
jgi:hypothetical protein